ncbi:MAG: glutaredoxin [Deltaproteobacteria bacterium]|nr:glutaredoxin [Deltaproteobacteria bacterium]
MTRPLLPPSHIRPEVAERFTDKQQGIVDEVRKAVADNDVVVVGMAINPHPGQARRALDAAGIAYKRLDYGSYLSMWKPRLALKLWTGYPTFPMVFVKGVLVGGASDVKRLLASGELQAMLAAPRPADPA